MDFISRRAYFDKDTYALVDSTHQANVRFFDDHNLGRFKRGESANYYGGFYEKFPVNVTPPRTGHWNVVVDTAGRSAFRASVQVFR